MANKCLVCVFLLFLLPYQTTATKSTSITAIDDTGSYQALLLSCQTTIKEKTTSISSQATPPFIPSPSAQRNNGVSTPYNATIFPSTNGLLQVTVTEELDGDMIRSSVANTPIMLNSCKPKVVWYSNVENRLYASCEIDQSNRIYVYKLTWNNGKFEPVGAANPLFYEGPGEPVRPVFLEPYGDIGDITMLTANLDVLFYYNVALSSRSPSALPDGCTRVLRVKEVLVNSVRKLLILCSDNRNVSDLVTSVHIDDLVLLSTKHYTLPSPVSNPQDVIVRFSANGNLVVMATGSQVIVVDGTSSNSLRTKQFSADVQDMLLLSDSKCAIVAGNNACQFSFDLLFDGQDPQCVSVSTAVCAPPTCPRLQQYDGLVYAVRDTSGAHNLTVFNATTLEQVITHKLSVAPKWLIFSPATAEELPTPAPSSTVAITEPTRPVPSSSLSPRVVNLNVMVAATISAVVVMAAIMIIAVIVIVIFGTRYLCLRKPPREPNRDGNEHELRRLVLNQTPGSSAASSVNTTPLPKHPSYPTSELFLVTEETTVTDLPPSRQPSPAPPPAKPLPGQGTRSIPIPASATQTGSPPTAPSSLPDRLTKPQQDSNLPPAISPNTPHGSGETVFPTPPSNGTSPSKPTTAADGASLLLLTNGATPTVLTNGTSPSKPTQLANGVSPSKPTPATTAGGPYRQETDRPPSSLDNP